MIFDLSISNSFFAMIPYVCLQSRNDSPTCTDFLPVAFTFKQRLLQSRTKNAFYPLGFAIFCNVLVYYGMSWPYLYHKHPNVQQEMRSNMSQKIFTHRKFVTHRWNALQQTIMMCAHGSSNKTCQLATLAQKPHRRTCPCGAQKK